MSISELRSKWRREQEYYKVREVGSSIQIFVKDVLKSPDILALRVGLNSTKRKNRRSEFLEEKKTKGSRRADITIFISPEIIIPVEVEKYENIEAGKAQLLQYQIDLEKKYGILTDGYAWRFYINNVYTEYTQETLLGKTDIFLEFWREYVKPEKYYLSFFEELGQLSLLREAEQLPVEENRQIFFEDITRLIDSFKNKLDIEGYLKDVSKKERTKKAVEITYAYIIQFILYKTLVDNEFDEFPREYKTLVEAIHSHLKANRFKDILGCIDRISAGISKNIYRPFSKEQEFIRERLMELYHKPMNELHDVSPWLDIFVFIKKYKFAEVRNEIFGYIYENYLKTLYEDQKKGQYFTDPAVVNFMLEQIGYTPEALKNRIGPDKNSISLIDPACGSGTFLYSAVDALIRTLRPGSEDLAKKVEELVNKDIFGLDIAEFPLYLAEMNILMRMLPLIINEKYNNPVEKKIKVFKTRDSVAEFMDTALRNTIHDIDVAVQKNNGQGYLFKEKLDLGYASYVRDEDDLKEMKDSLENWPRCPRRRFDFVVANPPYVSYNESSKQGVLIFKLIKPGKDKKADLNNIYGVNLHSIPARRKKYSPKPNLYAFFIALGLALLKDNGKICYIIPQTILTAGDLDVLRHHLAKFTTIEKIITFGGKMFIGRGLKQNRPVATSSLIFVVRRCYPDKRHQVEVINCKDVGAEIETTIQNIRDGRKISRKKLLQGKLLESVTNWNFIRQEKSFLDFYDMYLKSAETISIYYNHALAENQFKNRFYFDGSFNIPTEEIQTDRIKDTDYWEIPSIKSRGFLAGVEGYYPKNKKIKIAEGSQGMKMLNTKYKVIWRYANPDKFLFVKGENVFPRFQQFCIASNSKGEILYLLSLLNSKITNLLIDRLLKSENEKDVLLGITAIKEFVRVPKIIEDNGCVKDEIIKRAEEMLSLEKVRLSDLVDFSGIILQKFDGVKVEGRRLVLLKGQKETRLAIKGGADVVEKTVAERYPSEELEFESGGIRLSELKELPAIDFQKQTALKDYIDDLVFALYLNVPLGKVGFQYADEIKEACRKSQYYRLTQS
jgi:type I restriction-modification system DNA methylase subunit